MDTLPMPLDGLGGAPGALDEFRVMAPAEIARMLKRLIDASATLNLNGTQGDVVTVTVWAADAERGRLSFALDATQPGLGGVIESEDVVAVGYLESVKLQFDLHNLVLVHGARGAVLQGSYPRTLFRFQRRNAYRVRPLRRDTPVARVRHSEIAEMQLALRVLDVSIGGCALFLPDDVPPMQVGSLLNNVLIDLDADTRFHVGLRLQHVTSLHHDSGGVRLGCEFVGADSTVERALQRFIDQTQKRGRLMSIG